MPRPEIELLAPAADADIGIAAVHHGADAVYIGGPAFGARARAANEVPEIERLVREAHRFGARIFVTLNTILSEEELEPARRLAWSLYEAGVDALIVQDMGVTGLDLPPLQLHASTQCDIRTPQKARFLQDAGFSQLVLARELSLEEIRAVAAEAREAVLEFFVHGALCVSYSGQCYVSHAQTGRSANRGDCSQACRLPYTLTDAEGRIVAHDKHLLSIKDNDQTENLEVLVDAGIRSFKIEGRYKDLAYVKNVTAHYRRHLDGILERRGELRRASSGTCRLFFTPDPSRNFHRGHTDYFVNGRRDDLGAFDSPKFAGTPIGHVAARTDRRLELSVDPGVGPLHNGDGLTFYDLQQELVGVQVNVARSLGEDPEGRALWEIEPNEPLSQLPDLRAGVAVSRNRDMSWVRMMEGRTAERRIAVDLLVAQGEGGLVLHACDEDGHSVAVPLSVRPEASDHPERSLAAVRESLSKMGGTIFAVRDLRIEWRVAPHLPVSAVNAWRRAAVEALEGARSAAFERLPRSPAADPPARYPEEHLTYLGNVANSKAASFYARHGVRFLEAAYEAHEEPGEVSLMITKHCVRWALSLCPKQAKGVTGVQGTVRAEPMTMSHGGERLTLRFDCKPCEMHVVGRMRRPILASVPALPIVFRTRDPAAGASAARRVAGEATA